MEFDQVLEQLRVAVEGITRKEWPTLDADTPLPALGLDSQDMLGLLLELEDIAGFVVDPDELPAEVFLTVGTMCDYVTRLAIAS
jgi:acyl carrier protein